MEAALRTRLKNASAVTAIVGNRIDWDVRPQATALPALVLETVIGNNPQHMQGYTGFTDTVVQFNCFAKSKKAAVELREAVQAAIVPEATVGGVEFLRATEITRRQRPSNTDTGFIHHEILEVRIWAS